MEYEGLHAVCFHRGHYGHKINDFPELPKEDQPQNPNQETSTEGTTSISTEQEWRERFEAFGEWMLTQRWRKGKAINPLVPSSTSNAPNLNKNKEDSIKTQEKPVDPPSYFGSRFSVISNLDEAFKEEDSSPQAVITFREQQAPFEDKIVAKKQPTQPQGLRTSGKETGSLKNKENKALKRIRNKATRNKHRGTVLVSKAP